MTPTKQIIHHRHRLAQPVGKRGKRGGEYKTRKSTPSEKVITPKLYMQTTAIIAWNISHTSHCLYNTILTSCLVIGSKTSIKSYKITIAIKQVRYITSKDQHCDPGPEHQKQVWLLTTGPKIHINRSAPSIILALLAVQKPRDRHGL